MNLPFVLYQTGKDLFQMFTFRMFYFEDTLFVNNFIVSHSDNFTQKFSVMKRQFKYVVNICRGNMTLRF